MTEPSYYLDASALIKLYLEEPESQLMRELWREEAPAFASTVALAETAAGIATAGRAGRVTDDQRRVAARALGSDWQEIDAIAVTEAIAESAAALALRRPLSGAEAIHLATALTLADEATVLVTWDRRLARAALGEGLAVAGCDLLE